MDAAAAPAIAAGAWQEAQDDEGNVYYYNSVTQESSWERPAEMDGGATEYVAQQEAVDQVQQSEASDRQGGAAYAEAASETAQDTEDAGQDAEAAAQAAAQAQAKLEAEAKAQAEAEAAEAAAEAEEAKRRAAIDEENARKAKLKAEYEEKARRSSLFSGQVDISMASYVDSKMNVDGDDVVTFLEMRQARFKAIVEGKGLEDIVITEGETGPRYTEKELKALGFIRRTREFWAKERAKRKGEGVPLKYEVKYFTYWKMLEAGMNRVAVVQRLKLDSKRRGRSRWSWRLGLRK